MRPVILSLVVSLTMAVAVVDSRSAPRRRPPIVHTIDGAPPLLRRRPVRRRYGTV
ncbi:MAG: hypothetical protein ACKOAX_05735 [Candidatus Kapaibacterium sp.]